MQDRNDDPSFADEEEKEEDKYSKILKEDQMYEEILSELKEQPVEILPEEPEPLNLLDYNIEHSAAPTEKEQ